MRNSSHNILEKDNKELVQHFGFRKLASGILVSAVIGAFFTGMRDQTVLADTTDNAVRSEQVVGQPNSANSTESAKTSNVDDPSKNADTTASDTVNTLTVSKQTENKENNNPESTLTDSKDQLDLSTVKNQEVTQDITFRHTVYYQHNRQDIADPTVIYTHYHRDPIWNSDGSVKDNGKWNFVNMDQAGTETSNLNKVTVSDQGSSTVNGVNDVETFSFIPNDNIAINGYQVENPISHIFYDYIPNAQIVADTYIPQVATVNYIKTRTETEKDSKTVTLHYKYADGSEASPDDQIQIFYTHDITYNEDTNQILKSSDWVIDTSEGDADNPGAHIIHGKWNFNDANDSAWNTLNNLSVPKIDGYIAADTYVIKNSNGDYVPVINPANITNFHGQGVPTIWVNPRVNAGSKVGSLGAYNNNEYADQTDHTIYYFKPTTQSNTVTRHIILHEPTGDVSSSQQWTFTQIIVDNPLANEHAIITNYVPQAILSNYTVPTIAGYTASMREIPSVSVNHNTKDWTVEVSYTPNPQSNTVTIVDDDNNGSQLGAPQIINGVTDSSVNWNVTIPKNYELISGNSTNGTYKFSATNQIPIVIHVKHQHQTTPESKTITRTIVDNIPGQDPLTTTQSVIFTRTNNTDLVTNQTDYGKWVSDNSTWVSYMAQGKSGYTPDKAVIDETLVTPDMTDQSVSINYNGNLQRLAYTIFDETDNINLAENQELATGKSDESIPSNTADNLTIILQQYLDNGYVLTSQDLLPTKFDHDDNNDQIVHVVLHHGTHNDIESRDVTRNIIIEEPEKTSQTVTQKVTVTRPIVVDNVNKKTISNGDWSKGTFATYTPNSIPGYTIEIDGVPANVVSSASVTLDANGNPQNGADVHVIYVAIPSVDPNSDNTDDNQSSTDDSDNNTDEEVSAPLPEDNADNSSDNANQKSISSERSTNVVPKSQKRNNKSSKNIVPKVMNNRFGKQITNGAKVNISMKGNNIVDVQANNSQDENKLPQTGEKNNKLGLLGASLVAIVNLLALFSFIDNKKRR